MRVILAILALFIALPAYAQVHDSHVWGQDTKGEFLWGSDLVCNWPSNCGNYTFICPANNIECFQHDVSLDASCIAHGWDSVFGTATCFDSGILAHNGSSGHIDVSTDDQHDGVRETIACPDDGICEISAEIKFGNNPNDTTTNFRDTLELRASGQDLAWIGAIFEGANHPPWDIRGECSTGGVLSLGTTFAGIENDILRYTYQYNAVNGDCTFWLSSLNVHPHTGDILGGSSGYTLDGTVIDVVPTQLEVGDNQDRGRNQIDNVVICSGACIW